MLKQFIIPKITPLFALLLLANILSIHAEDTTQKRRVMAWVPPYALEVCNQRLAETYNGHGLKEGLTHLGLQFWNPTEKGELKLVTGFNKIDEKAIAQYRQWADSNQVKLMLCIYNGSTAKGWDWQLAKSAFGTNCNNLVSNLVNETIRLNLDGVDIDFEGKGDLNQDKKAYVKFIKILSKRLKEEGKELTIDSFAYKWHAPNQSWWKELLPFIDGLHVMGYSETGSKAENWRSYKFLKDAAGAFPQKIIIGVPSHKSTWQNSPALQHINWILDDSSVGLAIWDAQLQDKAWRTKEIWQKISQIKAANK